MEYKPGSNCNEIEHPKDIIQVSVGECPYTKDISKIIEDIQNAPTKEDLLQNIKDLNTCLYDEHINVKNYEDSEMESIFHQQITEFIEADDKENWFMILNCYTNWLCKTEIPIDVPKEFFDLLFSQIEKEVESGESGEPFDKNVLNVVCAWISNITIQNHDVFDYFYESKMFNIYPHIYRICGGVGQSIFYLVKFYELLIDHGIEQLDEYSDFFNAIQETDTLLNDGIPHFIYECVSIGPDFVFFFNNIDFIKKLGGANDKDTLKYVILIVDTILTSDQEDSIENVRQADVIFSFFLRFRNWSDTLPRKFNLLPHKELAKLLTHYLKRVDYFGASIIFCDSMSDYIDFCINKGTYEMRIAALKMLNAMLSVLNPPRIYAFLSTTTAQRITDLFDDDDPKSSYLIVKILLKIAEAGISINPKTTVGGELMFMGTPKRLDFRVLANKLKSEDFAERMEEELEGAPEDFQAMADRLAELADELYEAHGESQRVFDKDGKFDFLNSIDFSTKFEEEKDAAFFGEDIKPRGDDEPEGLITKKAPKDDECRI